MVCVDHDWGYGGRDHITDEAALAVGCEAPYWLRCNGCEARRLVRCGRASARRCAPCADRSRARVGLLAGSGLRMGREGLFVTLTAPSWVEHFLPNGERCRCTGGDCPDLAGWNASAGKRWNRFMQDLRRMLGMEVAYFKAAEVQRRGALHFHALIRPEDGRVMVLRVAALRRLAIKHGFGHSVDVQAVRPEHAGYVAKYASKSAGDRPDVPWHGQRWQGGDWVDKRTGELHHRPRVRVPAYHATYRTWSCSRSWGDTMRAIRAAQAHYLRVLEALPSWADRESVPAGWAALAVPLVPTG